MQLQLKLSRYQSTDILEMLKVIGINNNQYLHDGL